jgi:gamma-glutamyltranspeptidase/glutathione hydrolase
MFSEEHSPSQAKDILSYSLRHMNKRSFFAIGLAVVFASAVALTQSNNRPVVGRSVVSTQLGIVAASHPLAARAGVEMLERGGNAIDAAIAANATIGLMEPAMNGIGGDLFVIYFEAKTGKLYGLNSGGWAPSGLTAQFLQSKGQTRMPASGIYTVTVPGAVAGWDALRSRFGTKRFSELLAPAVYYAENGFPVSEVIARGWGTRGSLNKLSQHPNTTKTFLIGGRAPKTGEIFRNPDLAKSLRLIADEGRDGFYKGPTAQAILQISKELGGTMTAGDLADYKPEWVTPISTTYRGWTISELPPNTTGIAALMMLNIMEQYPLGDWGFHSTKALHVMIESKKLAYADLIRYIGDPGFSKLPVDVLLAKSHGAARSKLIDMNKAACNVEPAHLEGYTNSTGQDTIYLSAIDKDGNIVSLIQSNYSDFGSGLVAPGTGFILHNRGALFTLEPNHPNTLAPRKRPLHTIIPAFMERNGVRIGFGIMGGFNQPQAHAQFVANIADYGFNIQEALEAGRFTKGTFQGCDVSIEPLVPESIRRELTALGHQLNVAQPRSGTFGWGQAVMSDPSGVHYGASEPRHDGAAIPQLPALFNPARR